MLASQDLCYMSILVFQFTVNGRPGVRGRSVPPPVAKAHRRGPECVTTLRHPVGEVSALVKMCRELSANHNVQVHFRYGLKYFAKFENLNFFSSYKTHIRLF